MTQNIPTQEDVAAQRLMEMLDASTTSVKSDLAQARGWLHSAYAHAPETMWRIDTLAGALGALANAWGRLVLWSRASGHYDDVQPDLTGAMDTLVDLRRRLVHHLPDQDDTRRLENVLDTLERVHQLLRRDLERQTA